MTHLGPYVALGFKDLSGKANAMTANRILFEDNYKYINKSDKEFKYITHFVQYEIQLGIH